MYWGVTDIPTEKLQEGGLISFRVLPFGTDRIKVQARCGNQYLLAYFHALLRKMEIDWATRFADLTGVYSQRLNRDYVKAIVVSALLVITFFAVVYLPMPTPLSWALHRLPFQVLMAALLIFAVFAVFLKERRGYWFGLAITVLGSLLTLPFWPS